MIFMKGLKRKKIAEITCKRRSQWYGHVARMANSRPPKFVLVGYQKMEEGMARAAPFTHGNALS